MPHLALPHYASPCLTILTLRFTAFHNIDDKTRITNDQIHELDGYLSWRPGKGKIIRQQS